MRDIADAVDVGDRRSAELHHKPSHGLPTRPRKHSMPAA
jgi:hypothetical protein